MSSYTVNQFQLMLIALNSLFHYFIAFETILSLIYHPDLFLLNKSDNNFSSLHMVQ